MKYKDTIDLYDDEGKLLKSGVTLDRISPLVNKGALNVIDLTKRTVAVNFAGIEDALKTGKIGGKTNQVLGRSMNCSCVKDVDALSAKIKDMVQVTDGDNTKITKVGGGKMILVEVPSSRLAAAATYDAASTAVAAATTYALVDQYKVDMFNGSYVKAAVWGTYPQTMHMDGGNVVSILNIPQNNEGLGYALRNIPANHAAMMTHRNAMQGAALCATFEQAGEFEMGAAIGPFERAQLLLYAYQGLNANNLVYDLVKANGKTGTIGTVVQSLVERAIEDKVIKAGKKGKSGYIFYDTKDPMMWNAYSSAGTLQQPWLTVVPGGLPRQYLQPCSTSTTCSSTRPASQAPTSVVPWVLQSVSRSSATQSTVAAAPAVSTVTTSLPVTQPVSVCLVS